MTDSSLAAFLAELRAFVAEREWEQFHNPKNLAMSVASEAGELLAEYRWVSTEAADAHGSAAPARDRILAELGDVGLSWLLLCDRLGEDPLETVRRKLEMVRAKYPADASRGRPDPPVAE